MRGFKPSILIAFAFVLAAASSLHSAAVTISPNLLSVVDGSSVQFTATVSGLTNITTTWSAGGWSAATLPRARLLRQVSIPHPALCRRRIRSR
jgi:hypothetical protein